MNYQLRRNQTLDANLQRICRKQVEGALEIVRGEREANDTPVHETRKHLKKARAALQIASDELGRARFKQQDHRFRDIARLISDVRDAEVRLQTVRQLQEITRRTSQQTFHKTEELLVAELEPFMAAFAGWQKQAAPELEKLREEIDAWPIGNLDCKMIRRAVQRAYKSARDALACAKAKPIPKNFHEFRSEAKRLLYQLRILRPINPVVIGALIDDLDSVGEVFGRSHDLCFLGERLRRDDGQTPGQETRIGSGDRNQRSRITKSRARSGGTIFRGASARLRPSAWHLAATLVQRRSADGSRCARLSRRQRFEVAGRSRIRQIFADDCR
jgi:Uncharacterized conserved protein